jgi:hypothetical protein
MAGLFVFTLFAALTYDAERQLCDFVSRLLSSIFIRNFLVGKPFQLTQLPLAG